MKFILMSYTIHLQSIPKKQQNKQKDIDAMAKEKGQRGLKGSSPEKKFLFFLIHTMTIKQS